MIKKTIITLLITVPIALILYGLVWMNLLSNSVYYAKNMPVDNSNDISVMMLADNLDWVHTPDIQDKYYDIDGTKSIKNNNKDRTMFTLWGERYDNGRRYVFMYKGIYYLFDSKLNIKYVADNITDEEIEKEIINVEEVKKEIYAFVQSIIDAQQEPIINLQWLFNKIYEDDFK